MKRALYSLLAFVLLFLSACQRDPEMLDGVIKLTTLTPDRVTATSAVSGGSITDNGGADVVARGVCWGTAQNPTVSGSHTTDGRDNGSYISNMTGLTPNTTYYVRAYATNIAGTCYGEQKSFRTQQGSGGDPDGEVDVTTTAPTNVAATSATCGGTISVTGQVNVTARGVCYGTGANPTVSGPHTNDGSGTGSFSTELTNLNRNTTYYVRAYATSSQGTTYGAQRSFKTLTGIAEVTTSDVSAITSNSAQCGGTVTTDGGSPITARGVCWGTSPNPSTSNSHTSDGSGTGTFTSQITGLTMGTTYYVRAYASNVYGTVYGEQRSFQPNASQPAVATLPVDFIKHNSARLHGNVVFAGEPPYVERGFVYGTSANPQFGQDQNVAVNGAGVTGEYTAQISGLSNNTTYHVRAYVRYQGTTLYGEDRTFTTHTANWVLLPGTGLVVQTIDVSSEQVNWNTANSLCTSSSEGGFTGWRLPTIDELQVLYQNRASIGGFQNGWYWSSSTETPGSTGSHQIMSFSDGTVSNNSNSSSRYARAVCTY